MQKLVTQIEHLKDAKVGHEEGRRGIALRYGCEW